MELDVNAEYSPLPPLQEGDIVRISRLSETEYIVHFCLVTYLINFNGVAKFGLTSLKGQVVSDWYDSLEELRNFYEEQRYEFEVFSQEEYQLVLKKIDRI